MANYADVLTDAPLPDMIDRFAASEAVAGLLAVPPQSSHHAVDIGQDGIVTRYADARILVTGRTEDTSSSDPRSSTSSTRMKISLRTRLSDWCVAAV